jgi:hypothetical protein
MHRAGPHPSVRPGQSFLFIRTSVNRWIRGHVLGHIVAIFAIIFTFKTRNLLFFRTYSEVRAHYEQIYEPNRRWTISAYRDLSLPDAIRQAADTKELTLDGPKKDQHKRYSWTTLNACRDALLARKQKLRSRAQSGFDSLLGAVGEVLDDAGLSQVRDLGRYDFAIKIGAALRVAPDERVYVHRKPLKIARAMGLPIDRDTGPAPYVHRLAFDEDLRSMHADSIENMLCNCGEDLIRVAHRVGR